MQDATEGFVEPAELLHTTQGLPDSYYAMFHRVLHGLL